VPLKVEPDTSADQMLAQIKGGNMHFDTAAREEVAPGRACKSRRVIEIVVFDEGAELRGPIVVCARDDLPRQIRVTVECDFIIT
jgi:hypothetical protein